MAVSLLLPRSFFHFRENGGVASTEKEEGLLVKVSIKTTKGNGIIYGSSDSSFYSTTSPPLLPILLFIFASMNLFLNLLVQPKSCVMHKEDAKAYVVNDEVLLPDLPDDEGGAPIPGTLCQGD